MKLKNNIKNNKITIFFILSNFINSLFVPLFSIGSIRIRAILFNLGFCILLGSFGFLYKKEKSRNRYYIWLSIILMITCIVNSIYYNYYDSFPSFSSLATTVFLGDVADAMVMFALKLTDWIYLWQIIVLIIMIKKEKETTAKSKKNFLITLFLSIFCLGIGCVTPPYNSYSRFIKLWNRVSVVDTWGVYIYQIDDLVQSLKPAFNNMFGYDSALKETKDYYEEKSNVVSTNKYTNIFAGKNVIAIHAESLQSFTLDLSFNGEELTPNLNKLINSGMYFSNFYAQVGVGTSSDSEFTYATSLLPSNNGTVFVNYFNNKYVTIQNLIKDKNYYVFSMHGNDGDFWNRDVMHANMGYDNFYSKSSYEIDEEAGLGLTDKSFFHQSVEKIKEIATEVNKPYYGTLITLSNHTPWNEVDKLTDYQVTTTVTIDDETITRDYLEGTTMGRYLKSVHYMDEAIGKFIEEMDAAGLLENTVIVIYGDHDAKLTQTQYDNLYNYDSLTDTIKTSDDPTYYDINEYEYELLKNVPFIIWTKDMEENTTIDTPMGMIDVLPTLGNMLGISNKYSLGQDIMSINKEDGIVVFTDGSFLTNKIYYNPKNNEYYTLGNYVITDDYLSTKEEYASKIIEISNNIITYDLLKDLE